MTTDNEYARESPSAKDCVLCDRVLAVFGLIVGLAFIYIAVDVFTNGLITTALTRGEYDDE